MLLKYNKKKTQQALIVIKIFVLILFDRTKGNFKH